VGDESLRAVEVQTTGDRLELRALERYDYPTVAGRWDPAARTETPEKRAAEVRPALQQFVSRHRLEGMPIAVAFPSQLALARTLTVPAGDGALADRVRAAVEKTIPFPIAEASWSFQSFGDGVVVAVAPRARTSELLVLLASDGVTPTILAPAPFPAASFLAATTVAENELVLVLDLDRDHTDLAVFDGSHVFTRSLRITGNDFAQKLSEYAGSSFPAAESFLRSARTDAETTRAYKGLEPAALDLVVESFNAYGFYRGAIVPGAPPASRAILVGDLARIKGLQARFQLSYGFPVQVLAHLDATKLPHGSGVDPIVLATDLPGFATAGGLALQAAGRSRWTLDLLKK
jgi:Tfp pilus assembly PilM family ATPase